MAVHPGIGVLEYLDYDGNVTHRDDWSVAIVGRQDWATLGAHTAVPVRYGYANAVYVQQTGGVANTGIEIAEATSEGWLLLDSDSDPVPSLGFSYYLADIGNPDYYQRFAEAVYDDAVAAGLTGVFLDNVDIDFRNLVGLVNVPINPRTTLAYTQADWADDSAAAYAYIGEYLQTNGMYLGGNANAFISGDSDSNDGTLTKAWWDMLTYTGGWRNGQGVFDHFMVERWMRTTKSGADVNRLSLSSAFYHYWDEWQSLVAYAQGKSSNFIAYDDTAHDGVTTDAASRYSRASFLLDWDGGLGVAIFKTSPSDPWLASMSDDLGMPTAASSSVATNVDRRDFDNGYVIVNHSSVTVTISGHTIPSGEAVIALTATPPPFPTLETPEGVCIAFANAALDETPSWTRLDDPAGYRLVTGYSIRRGNDSELDKAATGTGTLKTRDLTGILDPTNPSSPFAGQLTAQKPAVITVQHPFTLEWHSLFRGFVDRYTHDLDMWTDERGIDRAEIELYDGFGYMSRVELMPTVHGHAVSLADFPDIYYQGTPSNLPGEPDVFVHWDDGIVKVLDDMGWPNPGAKREGLRDVFSGNTSLQGRVVDRGDGGMAALNDIVDAEFPGGANHYMSKEGVYRARGRFSFLFPENPGYGINFWNAGTATIARSDPSVAAISGLQFADGEILNSVGAWPQGVTDADVPGNLVEDAASIAEFGRSGATFPDLIVSAGHDDDGNPTTAVEETYKFADFYVGNRKDPRTVITGISFVGRTDDELGPAIWDLICGVEIGDVISLETTHAGGGGFDEQLLVDSITHERDAGQLHQVHLGVSPRPTYNPFGDFDSGVS